MFLTRKPLKKVPHIAPPLLFSNWKGQLPPHLMVGNWPYSFSFQTSCINMAFNLNNALFCDIMVYNVGVLNRKQSILFLQQ
nr:MAG TPA: hypothetical protein [Caudoviricetes sp.]